MKRLVPGILAAAAALAVAAYFLLGGPGAPRDAGPPDAGRDRDGSAGSSTREPVRPLPPDIREILLQGPEFPPFRELLARANRLDATAAATLIAMVGDPSVRDDARDLALLLLARHPSADVGERLVDLLSTGRIHLENLVLRLIETLRDRHDEDQAPRLAALIRKPVIPPGELWMLSEGVRWLGQEPPLEELRQVLNGRDPMRRAGAAVALLHAGGAGVSPEVDDLLRREPELVVRHETLRALALRRDPASQRYLADLIGDSTADPELRGEAVRALDRVDDEEAAGKLVDIVAAGEAPPEVLLGAADALGRANAKDVARRVRGTLRAAPRVEARIAAADAVRRTGDREGLDDVRSALAETAAHPPALRVALARTLGEVGGRADRTTLEAMGERDPDESVREAAKQALERLDEILLSDPNR